MIQKVQAVHLVLFCQHFQQVQDHLSVLGHQEIQEYLLLQQDQNCQVTLEYQTSPEFLHHHQLQDFPEVPMGPVDLYLLVVQADLAYLMYQEHQQFLEDLLAPLVLCSLEILMVQADQPDQVVPMVQDHLCCLWFQVFRHLLAVPMVLASQHLHVVQVNQQVQFLLKVQRDQVVQQVLTVRLAPMVPHLLLGQKDPVARQDHWDQVVLMDLVDQVTLAFLKALADQ